MNPLGTKKSVHIKRTSDLIQILCRQLNWDHRVSYYKRLFIITDSLVVVLLRSGNKIAQVT